MAEKEMTKIDLSNDQISDIKSKLALLREITREYNVPMFSSVVVLNTNEDTKYLRLCEGQARKDICLTENQIKHVDVQLAALKETAQICGVPMFATVCVFNSDKETKYLRMVHAAQSHAIKLFDDEIRKHMLIANGFYAIPKQDVPEARVNQIMHETQPYGTNLIDNEIRRHALVSFGFDVDSRKNVIDFKTVSKLLQI